MRELAAVRFASTLAMIAALAAAALSRAEAQDIARRPVVALTIAPQTFGPQVFRIGAFRIGAFPTPASGAQALAPAQPASWLLSQADGSAQLRASPADTGWSGLVWPPMSGEAVALGLADGDALHGVDGRSLVVGRYGEADGPFGRFADSLISRDWPSAVQLKTGAFGFDVSPHAGVGRSGDGDSQNAGALVRFGRGLGGDQNRRPSRWFLFASTDQQTLATGFTRNADTWKQRVGLGPDPGATIDDTRAGVAWSNGPFEASVGYLFREVRPRNLSILDVQSTRESLFAFRLAFHPWAR